MAINTGTATLRFVQDHHLDQHAAAMGERLMMHLRQLQQKFSCLGDLRGRGLMVGMEVVDVSSEADPLGSYPPDPELAQRIQGECLKRGLIFELGGRRGGTIRLLPPLIVTKDDVDRIIEIIGNAVAVSV